MGPFVQAELALQILQRLADAQAAVDSAGQPLQPLPLARRLIASPQCLPHIAQVRPWSYPVIFRFQGARASLLASFLYNMCYLAVAATRLALLAIHPL